MPSLLMRRKQFFPLNLVSMQNGLPPSYTGTVMHGSTGRHIMDEVGEVVVQEIRSVNYILRYNFYLLFRKVKMHFNSNDSGFHTTAILRDECRETIAAAGRFRIREGYFSALFSNARQGYLECEPNRPCTSFETTWTSELLQHFLPEDSHWWKDFENSAVPQIIGHPFRRITPALNEIINQFIFSSYDESLREYYIDDLLKTYLIEVLNEIRNPHWLHSMISRTDMEKIEAARALIAGNPMHHIHTSEIARRVNMNECYLKALFVKATGMGTFDYMMYLRCSAVRDRILSTDLPLKAFVKECGYNDLANFVTGFKRHMGCTPAEVRKR